MRTADADILLIPGWTGSGPDHWQSRWERKLSTARRVQQADWDRPVLNAWVARLVEAVEQASQPVVLVAHSIGINAAVAAAELVDEKVIGAYLVAPVDFTPETLPADIDPAFLDVPLIALPFPSVLIGSTSDPYCRIERAKELAEIWGSEFVDAGESGHLNTESGHGPWPDGLLRFAGFMSKLGKA